MISQALVELIEKNAGRLAHEWLKDVIRNVNTPFFRGCDADELYERGFEIYRNLGHWLSLQTSKSEIAEHYQKYGRERFREGYPLGELIYSFILFRRHLWLFVLQEGFYDSAYELHRALELNNRVILFFDRAMHNMAVGYEKALKGASQ